MKKFVLSCIFAICCIALAIVAAFYIGNRPLFSYYPNKQVRASVPRHFFIPHGISKVYHQNGKLSYQYQIVNNINNGEVLFFLPKHTLTMHYVNEKLLGPVQIKDKADQIKNIKIVFAPENKLEVSFAQNDSNLKLLGHRLCSDDDFLANLEHYSASPVSHTLENVLACFKIESLSYNNINTECQLKGEYIYPQFKTDFQSVCLMNNSGDGLLKDFKALKIEGLYSLKDDKIKIRMTDQNKKQSFLNLSYKGVNEVIKNIVNTYILADQDSVFSQILSVLMNDLSFSDSRLVINGKKIWDIKGDFNVVHGFSSPYYVSSYTDNEVSSQIKISSGGLNLKALYPISRTPMISFGLNINELFKSKYQNLITNISRELLEQVQDQNTLSNVTNYAWEFSDLFQSAYLTIMDIQGSPVTTFQAKLKTGLSAQTISKSPTSAFDITLTTYQNGEPSHHVVGDFTKGFIIDNQEADPEEVFALLNNTSLNAVLDDISNELELKYGPIIQKAQTPEDYIGVDPFFLGFYSGYKSSVMKFKLKQTIDQIMGLAYGLQSLYAEDGNYNHLSASDLKNSGIITSDMLNKDNVLLNAFGGKIRILKSMAQSDSSTHDAFILAYDGLPSEACFELSTINWAELNPGFIAVKASARGTADVTKAYANESFEKRPSQTVYKPFDAQRACSNGTASSVALKFE